MVKVFWSLDARLAYERHFPAIDWLASYSLYEDAVDAHLGAQLGDDALAARRLGMRLLEEENELKEIVRLVGLEALSPQQRLTLRTARAIREDFLHQNAFVPEDSYTSFAKQYALLRLVVHLYEAARAALDEGVGLDDLLGLPVWAEVARAKYVPEDELERFEALRSEVTTAVASLRRADVPGGDGVAVAVQIPGEQP